MLPQGELLFRDEQSGHVRLFEGEEPDFLGMPPAYPVRLPSLPTTRWQGMIMLIGLCPTAPPMACADMVCFPCCRAISSAISL